MMKTIIASSVLVLINLFVHAQSIENITIGKKETIFSTILNENRKIWIYHPNITSPGVSPDKRFPVLYLLDGDAHFFSTVGIIQQLSQANGNGVLPEMIVVAIENTNRFRDLVPSGDITKPNPFIKFISSELVPYIDKTYNTAPYKLLVGHSLGGLTAIDALTNFPESFNAYIAIDPSMWYSNEKFLRNTINKLSKQNIKGKRLFIGTANTMPPGMMISQLKKDKSSETQHIRSILKLDEFLESNKNGLLYSQKYYPSDGHNSVPLISEYDGLRFIFDFYQFDATEKDFTDSTALLASKLKSHYALVSNQMGYKNSAPEAFIKYLAYDALGKKQFNRAQSLFELNMESYPESIDVYESYADYYLAKIDTASAISQYKKALQIKNNASTQIKLDALISKESTNLLTADLKKYIGTYVLEAYNLSIILEIRAGNLWAIVPGDVDSELQLLSDNVFTVKGKPGYTITFQMEGNKSKGFTSVQPNGTFKAVFKK